MKREKLPYRKCCIQTLSLTWTAAEELHGQKNEGQHREVLLLSNYLSEGMSGVEKEMNGELRILLQRQLWIHDLQNFSQHSVVWQVGASSLILRLGKEIESCRQETCSSLNRGVIPRQTNTASRLERSKLESLITDLNKKTLGGSFRPSN